MYKSMKGSFYFSALATPLNIHSNKILFMNIIESDDNHLRQLIFEKEKVIAKFVNETCPVCERLAPAFSNLSTNPDYSDIAFVRMHASQNPVSSQEVKLTGTPFFAIYLNGTLQECGLLSSEEEIKQLLQKLK